MEPNGSQGRAARRQSWGTPFKAPQGERRGPTGRPPATLTHLSRGTWAREPVPWYKSRLSCSRLSFSCRKWPRYRCRRYRQALFLMDSENGQGMVTAGRGARGGCGRRLRPCGPGSGSRPRRRRRPGSAAGPKPGTAPPWPLGARRPSGRPHRRRRVARARPGGDQARGSPRRPGPGGPPGGS